MNQSQPPSTFWQSGQAALIATILILGLAVTIALSLSAQSIKNVLSYRQTVNGLESYYLAEGGIEDSLLRLINPDYDYETNNTVTLGSNEATTTIAETGNTATVTSQGDVENFIRTATTSLEKTATGASFFYGIQVDNGGLTMGNNSQVNGNVFSNGNIVGSNGAIITGDATVSGGLDDAPAVESTAQNTDHTFATASDNRDIAQSFHANESGPLAQVAVYLAKVGNPSNDITLRLTNDNGGKPETSSLANVTIPRSSVSTTAGWVTASFISAPDVASGTKYWIVLDYGNNSTSNYWNWRKDSTGGYANNTGSYTSSWSSGSATWTSVNGDLAFQTWIGGEPTSIQDATIGDSTAGTGHANQFINTTIHGSACPNQYCIVENPGRQELPIPPETIAQWQADAEAGGTHSGDYTLADAAASIGPLKITGDLLVDNNATLTLTGTIWVQGDIQLSNGCIIQLDESYGSSSGILLTDEVVQVSNNCTFSGSGEDESYVLLLSNKDDTENTVMTISNNAVGVVYYAPRGRIHFSNNAAAKEATAYGMTLDNGATITYESGLENINFSSGPSGGWTFGSWKEID